MPKDQRDRSTAILAVDTGGTFTDFYLASPQGSRIHKVLSTPRDPSRAILKGIQEMKLGPVEVVHGSTVATNAFLERKGAKVALITTAGFEDVLEIGRQNRPSLYDLATRRTPPLVNKRMRFGVPERMSAGGKVEKALTKQALQSIRQKIKSTSCDCVAICLMFSYANAKHEKLLRKILGKLDKYLSVSSEICPEYREYERTSTTCINAYVAPIMGRYLKELKKKLKLPVRIMQSNGGSLSLREASHESVRTLLSGPAGGALGAYQLSKVLKAHKVMTLDMGGTSTDMSLMDGQLELTTESSLGGLPIKTPMIRIDTIGAGGGSIAWIDQGGALRVGPQSAGADPGPICYGSGGKEVTITDAHVFLGRLPPRHFLGGNLQLQEEKIPLYLKKLSKRLKLSLQETAQGILTVANANMARALRVLSLERGYDPREFTLMPFGGAGGLHACELANLLGMTRVLVPHDPGILSAFGMAHADWVRDHVQTVLLKEEKATFAKIKQLFKDLEDLAKKEARREGFSKGQIKYQRQMDIRYLGQSYELTVPASSHWAKDFAKAHRRHYGFTHQQRLEVVNLRLQARVALSKKTIKKITSRGRGKPIVEADTQIYWNQKKVRTPILNRDKLLPGHGLTGPAIVAEFSATTFVPPKWKLGVDPIGNLILNYD